MSPSASFTAPADEYVGASDRELLWLGAISHAKGLLVSSLVFTAPAHRFVAIDALGALFSWTCIVAGLALFALSAAAAAAFLARMFPRHPWGRYPVYVFYGIWIGGMLQVSSQFPH